MIYYANLKFLQPFTIINLAPERFLNIGLCSPTFTYTAFSIKNFSISSNTLRLYENFFKFFTSLNNIFESMELINMIYQLYVGIFTSRLIRYIICNRDCANHSIFINCNNVLANNSFSIIRNRISANNWIFNNNKRFCVNYSHSAKQ